MRSLPSLIVSISLLVSAFASTADAQAKKKQFSDLPAPVEVAAVVEKIVSAPVDLVGTVQALTDSVVSAETAGRVVAFDKIEGSAVRRGEAVVMLDETPYKIDVRAARGRLAKAEVSLGKAQLAESRTIELYEQDVASQEARQNSELEVRFADAEVALGKADLERAEFDLSRCQVSAPFSGFISRKLVDVGEWVKEGTGLFEIIDIHKVDVVVEAPERQIEAFEIGKEASLTLDAHPGKTYKGKIKAVSPKADLRTRTFMVKIDVDNESGEIMAGMVARVSVASREGKRALMIPRDAVVWKARRSLVYSVTEDGKAREWVVSLGRQQGEMIEIKTAFEPGFKLIVTGNEILRDGQPVTVVGEKKFD